MEGFQSFVKAQNSQLAKDISRKKEEGRFAQVHLTLAETLVWQLYTRVSYSQKTPFTLDLYHYNADQESWEKGVDRD